MNNRLSVVCGALLVVSWGGPAQAADYRVGSLTVSDPWSRPTPPMATVGAVYLSITNPGPGADRLLGASSPVARSVELHQSNMVNGIMQMRPIDGVACAPGSRLDIAPGGVHLMLAGLRQPLTAGMPLRLTLRFEHAGDVTIDVRVGTAP